MKGFNLKSYSVLSGVFLLGGTSQGQINYMDLDPDIVVDVDNSDVYIDIDGDGSMDVNFFRGYATPSVYSTIRWYRGIVVDVLPEENGVAGLLNSGPYGYTFRNYAYALQLGERFDEFLPIISDFNVWVCNREYWFSEDWFNQENGNWPGVTVNRYIGFLFSDSFGENHYGWIRCSGLDSSRMLVVHDYAWEETPNAPIVIGETTISLSTESGFTDDIKAYPNPSSDVVTLELPEGEIYTMQLLDQSGRIQHQQKSYGMVQLDITGYPKGWYSFRIIQEDKVKVIKVLFL